MIEMKLIAQYITLSTLVISIINLLQVSYKVSAYRPLTDLKALEFISEPIENVEEYEPEIIRDSDEDVFNDIQPTDKRYARLSYYHGGTGNSRRYNHNSRYYRNYYKPWLNLPDEECLDRKCRSNSDCCRRFSRCDQSEHIYYNCWYGHPCRTSRECCERYPYCNKRAGGLCQT